MATNRAIYHITHVENLASILAEGRLWSDSQRVQRVLANTNIGYSHIKARRLVHPVAVSQGGTLGDYVPFNFCFRSVMLYVVSRGHLDYQGGQDSILHLVSGIDAAVGTGRPWFFTDRHADLDYAGQFDDLTELHRIDWSVMPVRQWGGDTDLQEKRQAEFLVHDWYPWTAIAEVAVRSNAVKQRVDILLSEGPHQPPVVVRPDWYY